MLGGCASKPNLVGTWNGTVTAPDGRKMPAHLTLRADGSFALQSEGLTPDYGGAYTVKDGVLTETVTGYIVKGHAITIPVTARHPQSSAFTLSGNTLTLTPQDGSPPLVLKRQK